MLLCIEGLFLELLGGRAAGCNRWFLLLDLDETKTQRNSRLHHMTLSMCNLDHPCVDSATRTGAWFGHLIDMMRRWMKSMMLFSKQVQHCYKSPAPKCTQYFGGDGLKRVFCFLFGKDDQWFPFETNIFFRGLAPPSNPPSNCFLRHRTWGLSPGEEWGIVEAQDSDGTCPRKSGDLNAMGRCHDVFKK